MCTDIKKTTLFSVALFLVLLLGCSTIVVAQLPPTFDVEVTLDHCPERKVKSDLALDIFYSVGEDPNIKLADVISSSYNSGSNQVTAVLRFPTSMGTTPFKVGAICRSPTLIGAASNRLDVSNCDYIATLDTDQDGIPNHLEDTDCNGLFAFGDFSNFENVDTDGDGVRDLVEVFAGTDLSSQGSSPVPYVFSSAPFDPDGDIDSNALVWRPSNGTFYVKDYTFPGNALQIKYGQAGDIPITYSPEDGLSDVGVIRRVANNELLWLLHGPGFKRSSGPRETAFSLGLKGDNLVHGPWETPGVTNPAITRLFTGNWTFLIKKRDGSLLYQPWGGRGDIPKPQDYDGDGIFDFAVFRPAEQKTYIIRSSDHTVAIIEFGTGTADHSVRGDYTGDGVDDIAFWEPTTGMFFTLKSDLGFDPDKASMMDPLYYEDLQLGLYTVHHPLSWVRRDGIFLYSVVDHKTGYRYIRPNNNKNADPLAEQWGLTGDHMG